MADNVQLVDSLHSDASGVDAAQANLNIIAGAPLAKLTSLRVGGKAEWLVLPKTVAQLRSALAWARTRELSVTMLGAGSNLLISDRGLPGLVVCTRALRQSCFDAVTGRVTAAAGEPWSSLAWKAARQGLKGFEWTIGIPGTVGGAVVMNAGAHGGETADILVETEVVDPDGTLSTLTPADLGFRYRTSNLQGSDRTVVSATFQLSPGHDPTQIKAATASDLRSRRKTQPYHLPNCGSVFRNPLHHSAGSLIQAAGLKGHQIGKAQTSTLHANFIVNLGGARADDVLALIHYTQAVIEERNGIRLEPEVKIIGDFDSPSFDSPRASAIV
ncbi:UDP-N-acetylenolpyruvoylglucosamine reductase [Synechococcus sp. PCC 7335]|uniref:UDP-N-acetylmuramate dehydrogenase n=1 Tax=Synechococcus sp. (strain ATCC 29403 / PCC 7335) TaxID=91464 RepID=UPI00017EBC71|nr:UDP-N-acetylmuramate dehydrogenase [Synechococcus sp. PCC 7335]EDX87016.1 UDP-N-acetylenolpyruvoylglucosamine reductase [Synechococcus sp. PCC 7335]